MIADLQAILDTSDFTREYGIVIESIQGHRVRARVPFRSHYVRPGGVVPGFIYMAAADVVMWLAVYAALGPAAELAVTTEMRTSFLSGVRGEDFWCEAEVSDVGDQLIFGTATCEDARGAIITHHTLTYIQPPSQQPPAAPPAKT